MCPSNFWPAGSPLSSAQLDDGQQSDAGTHQAATRAAGCRFERHEKGDHDIGYSLITGIRFPADHTIKSRHTANAVLKQAGLPRRSAALGAKGQGFIGPGAGLLLSRP